MRKAFLILLSPVIVFAGIWWLRWRTYHTAFCPPNTRIIHIVTRYYKGDACSLRKEDFAVDGYQLWQSPGAPARTGIEVHAPNGKITGIKVSGPTDPPWHGPRGITYGTPCSVVVQRFGIDHEGGDGSALVLVYYAKLGYGDEIRFACPHGVVTAVDVIAQD